MMVKHIWIFFFTVIWSSLNAQVRMEKQKDGILFTENGQNVLFYQMNPKNINGDYGRNHYIHPFWGLDGTVLTEDFPADHLHHRGVFWAWHQVWIGDKRIGDPWEIKDFSQEINDVEYFAKTGGMAVFNIEVSWKSPLWKNNGKMEPYMNEKTTITIHPQNRNFRQIDFEIHLLALVENLSIGGSEDVKGYSGFSVRMVLPEDVSFTGPSGEVEPKNEAVNSEGYINVSGSLLGNGKRGGVVIVDDQQNPGYPQPWILRKRNSMQNAAFPGNRTVPVSTQKPLVLKYSLLVYSGKLADKKIQKIMK